MYPQLPILKIPIKYSGASSYNPHNFILKIEDKLGVEPFDGIIEYNSTTIHEWTHWIQHHSTTVGTFLHALRYTQKNSTLSFLRDLPKKERENLLLNRDMKKSPIVLIDPNSYQLKRQNFSSNSDQINLFGEIWYELQWIYSFFSDSNISSSSGVPTGDIFGDSIGLLFYHYFSGKGGETEYANYRKWYNFSDNKIKMLSLNGEHLTTDSLMECSASISEIQMLKNNIHTPLHFLISNKDFSRTINSLLGTRYGLPFKLFMRELDVDISEISNVLSTINLIIFIALNPPLPPYSFGPPKNSVSWAWDDIYPPIRFLRAIQSVKKIGLIKSFPNHFETEEYLQKIVHLSELPTILNNEFQETGAFRQFDFSDKSLVFDPNKVEFDSFDFTYWVQKKFSLLRNNKMPFLTNFSNCLVGDFATEFFDLTIISDDVFFSRAPFEWKNDNKLTFGVNRSFYNSLIRTVGLDYCLFDTVVGQGAYDLEAFPPEVNLSKEYRESMVRMVRHAIIEGSNIG